VAKLVDATERRSRSPLGESLCEFESHRQHHRRARALAQGNTRQSCCLVIQDDMRYIIVAYMATILSKGEYEISEHT